MNYQYDRVETWRNLYQADPSRIRQGQGFSDAVYTVPADYYKNTVSEEIKPDITHFSEPGLNLRGQHSMFYRDTPESMIVGDPGEHADRKQIGFHRSTAEQLMNALRNSDPVFLQNISSVVIYDSESLEHIKDLIDYVTPDALTLLETSIYGIDLDLVESLAGYVTDFGISTNSYVNVTNYLERLPLLQRLRINQPSIAAGMRCLEFEEFLKTRGQQLTHLILNDAEEGNLISLQSILPIIEYSRTRPLDYLQISCITAEEDGTVDLTPMSNLASGVYAMISRAKKVILSPQLNGNKKRFHAGIIWHCLTSDMPSLSAPDFCPDFAETLDMEGKSADILNDDDNLVQCVSVFQKTGINEPPFTGFMRPNGSLIQGYYTPKIFSDTVRHYFRSNVG